MGDQRAFARAAATVTADTADILAFLATSAEDVEKARMDAPRQPVTRPRQGPRAAAAREQGGGYSVNAMPMSQAAGRGAKRRPPKRAASTSPSEDTPCSRNRPKLPVEEIIDGQEMKSEPQPQTLGFARQHQHWQQHQQPAPQFYGMQMMHPGQDVMPMVGHVPGGIVPMHMIPSGMVPMHHMHAINPFSFRSPQLVYIDPAAYAATAASQVSFQWKNPDFLLKHPDFLLKHPDFLLKNPDFLLRNDFILQ